MSKTIRERVLEALPCVRNGLRGKCGPEYEPDYRVCHVCNRRPAVEAALRDLREECAQLVDRQLFGTPQSRRALAAQMRTLGEEPPSE